MASSTASSRRTRGRSTALQAVEEITLKKSPKKNKKESADASFTDGPRSPEKVTMERRTRSRTRSDATDSSGTPHKAAKKSTNKKNALDVIPEEDGGSTPTSVKKMSSMNTAATATAAVTNETKSPTSPKKESKELEANDNQDDVKTTRRTRSRSKSSEIDREDTPVKLSKKDAKKKKKTLDVIPELVASPGGETTEKKGENTEASNTVDAGTVSSKSSKKKRKSQGKEDAEAVDETTVTPKSPNERNISPPPSIHEETPSTTEETILQPTNPPIIPNKKPIFDSTIHRLRFLKVSPRGILAMASSPWYKQVHGKTDSTWCTMVPDPAAAATTATTSGGSTTAPTRHVRKHQLLAISREGGGVEVIDPAERWVAVGMVPGVRERMVDALIWVCGDASASATTTDGNNEDRMPPQDKGDHTPNYLANKPPPQLIGASRDGTIFHLNLSKQRQTHVIGSGAGGVFCLASLCSRGKCSHSCPGYFAAGCEDGTVKIYNGKMDLISTLPGVGNAVLSLDWVGDGGLLGGSVIYAGVADGTIRRFDCVTTSSSSGGGSIGTGVVLDSSNRSVAGLRWKPTLRMVLESRGLRESTRVWALRALSDGTVISGDSFGNVQFWDGLMGTMIQTFSQSESNADVLCLAVSDDEDKVFASGVDTRVMCIQRQGRATSDPAHFNPDSAPIRKWVNVLAHRKHIHDVRALAIVHKKATGSKKKMELLVSGSIDTRLCTYLANKFKASRPRIWFNWSSLSPISLAKELRLLAVTRSDKVDLYSLGASVDLQDSEVNDESKCLIKTISIKSPFNLICSAISDDGKFLAASDASKLYVFSLEASEKGGILDLNPTKIRLPKECSRPSTALRFDSTNRLICATIDGSINILQLSTSDDDEDVSLEHVFKEHLKEMNFFANNGAVVSLDVSLDGKYMTMMRFSNEKGSVHAFCLEPFGHWWSLPEIESTATCVKFLGENSLAVGCANNAFYIFNIQRRELSNWSSDMGLPIVESLPRQITSRTEPLARILFTPSLHQKLILVCHLLRFVICLIIGLLIANTHSALLSPRELMVSFLL